MNEIAPIRGSAAIAAADHLNAIYWSTPRTGRICWILIPVFGLPTLALEFYDGDSDLTALIALLVAFAFLPIIFLLGHWRLSEAQKRISYEVDRENIVLRDAEGTSVVVPWTLARRAIETKSGFMVRLRPTGGRWLPKRAFSPEAVADLRRLIKDKLGPAAKLGAT